MIGHQVQWNAFGYRSAYGQFACGVSNWKSPSLRNTVFWEVTPCGCGSCKNRCFVGTYRLHHQGDKNQRARYTLAVARNRNTQRKRVALRGKTIYEGRDVVSRRNTERKKEGFAHRSGMLHVIYSTPQFRTDLNQIRYAYLSSRK
jgi:hypothetical protein